MTPSEVLELIKRIPPTHSLVYSKPGAVVIAHVVEGNKTLCGVELPKDGFSKLRPLGMSGVCGSCGDHFRSIEWRKWDEID
jgi:hypothetical protein